MILIEIFPEMFTALSCAGVETVKNKLSGSRTNNAAKHDGNSISGKVHVSDATSEARTELAVCLCDDNRASESLVTTVFFCIG